ncbi:hypothetical protein FKM82_024458 [Ascaphus truei]
MSLTRAVLTVIYLWNWRSPRGRPGVVLLCVEPLATLFDGQRDGTILEHNLSDLQIWFQSREGFIKRCFHQQRSFWWMNVFRRTVVDGI